MSTIVHGPAATWAAAHRAVLFLLVLAVAVVAAVTVVLAVQSDSPATGSVAPAAPAGTGEPACADDLPMTGTFC
jgi:Ni,Fe-hydrogenase III component G